MTEGSIQQRDGTAAAAGTRRPRPPLAPGAYRTEICGSPEGLERLLPEWNALFERSSTASAFVASGWMATWWNLVGSRIPGARLAVVVARDDDARLVGLLPLYAAPARPGPVAARILRLLGTGEMAPEHLDALIAEPDAAAIGDALLAGLEAVDGGFDVLDLTDLARDGVLPVAAARWAALRGYPVRLRDVEHCPYVATVGSFETYLMSLASSHRYKIRHFWRRLTAEHHVEMSVIRSPAEMEAAVEEVFRLHALRWAMKGGVSSFDRPVMRSFHRQAAVALAATRGTRVFLLRCDGRVIAATYCLEAHGHLYFYQPGFDPAFARFHVGKLLLAHVLETCFASEVTEFDFLRGLEPYKFDWTHAARGNPCLRGRSLPAGPMVGGRARRPPRGPRRRRPRRGVDRGRPGRLPVVGRSPMRTEERLRAEIEAEMARRIGRECVFMPSGRIAVYCALRARLHRGDAVLMSPVNDDVVLFAVLAAGMRPVMAPLSAEDGNLDVDGIPEETWRRVRAVLTTNLYGVPDRIDQLRERSASHGVTLFEDAAHAIETVLDGRPVGTTGEMAVFSLSKHIETGWGGILALADGAARGEIERLRDTVERRRGPGMLAMDYLHPRLRVVARRARVAPLLRRTGLVDLVTRPERGSEHRMPLRPGDLERAVAGEPSLDAFDTWVRVDGRDYRHAPGVDSLRRTLGQLRRLDEDAERRMDAVDRLRRSSDLVAGVVRRGDPIPLFRIPLLVDRREESRAELARRGYLSDYIYDPPLDDYAGPRFADASPAPDAGRWWARHVLPVNPLHVDRVLRAFTTWSPPPAPEMARSDT